MNRNISILSLLAFLAGAGSFFAIASSQTAADQNPFESLRLGMSSETAFSLMQQLDPAAFTGPVCSGADGIAARVTHLGMTWQLSAHNNNGKIDELVLERHSQEKSDTATSCRATFEKHVVPHYNRMQGNPTWTTRDEDHHLHVLHSTSTPQSQTLSLFAGRQNRTDALCTYRIAFR